MPDRLALFTGGQYAISHAKTAHGILRYGPREVVAVVDDESAGRAANEVVPYARRDTPIVATVAEAAALGANVLVIGVAPFGGALTDEWRVALLEAIDAGMHLEAGLHTVLAEDPEISAAAAKRRRRAPRPPRRPARLERPARRAPGRARRPHRRLGLRDRQDVGDARARRGRSCAGSGVGLRGHRADRDRDHRLGDRRRPRDLGLHLRRGVQARARRGGQSASCCSSRARAAWAIPRIPA